MPRTKAQNEQIRTEKRQIILDAALELFADDGYAHTSIDKIAKHAKIAKGLIYTYFKSKEDLLLQILTSWEDKFPADTFKAEMTPVEFLAAMNLFIDSMAQNKDFYRLYTALGTQPSVVKKLGTLPDNKKLQEAFFTFYQKQFGENAINEMLLMTSMLKGFSIIYLFGDEQNLIPTHLLKDTILNFVKERFDKYEKNIDADVLHNSGNHSGLDAKPKRHGNSKKG